MDFLLSTRRGVSILLPTVWSSIVDWGLVKLLKRKNQMISDLSLKILERCPAMRDYKRILSNLTLLVFSDRIPLIFNIVLLLFYVSQYNNNFHIYYQNYLDS